VNPAKMYIVVFVRNTVKLSEIDSYNRLINDRFYELPSDVKVISADIIDEDEGLIIAALCESTNPMKKSKEVFYVDWNSSSKNNIFPDLSEDADKIFLSSAGKHYIFAGKTVNCAENDNMSDLHNFPPCEDGFLIGEYDLWSLRALTFDGNKTPVWKYGL
jgi:hypothetical protein